MEKIDSHQHFWKFDPIRDYWINEEISILQKDFLPEDLKELIKTHEIDGCIAVQSCSSEEDNSFLLDLSLQNPIIKGIVGWIDFQSENLESRLEYFHQWGIIKGFRHNLQSELEEGFMLGKNFKRGISLLNSYGFTYDLVIKPHQLPTALELIKSFPKQRFVIDHMAKPLIRSKIMDPWRKDIFEIAQFPNVYCKVSGYATEADWNHWELYDILPYFNTVIEAFGSDRIMYGSDWPLCNLAKGYEFMIQSLQNYMSTFSPLEQAKFWGQNAIHFYELNEFNSPS